jgi:uncharacterized delta-60 repeat protein
LFLFFKFNFNNAQDGNLDLSFEVGNGFNEFISRAKIQNDGKIIVTGGFSTYNETPINRIVRLNQDGSLDTSFNSQGSGPNFGIQSLAIQNDGKILIGGNFTSYNSVNTGYIARLNIDGSLDTSFNSGGIGANGEVTTIVIQPDGKILIGGWFNLYNDVLINHITRLNYDGSLDTTFNSSGSGINNTVEAISLQSDGKIIVGGMFDTFNDTEVNFLIRLNTDGSYDESFNTAESGVNDFVNTITIDSSDKIYISGAFTTFNGVQRNHLARLNSNGTLDNDFYPEDNSINDIVKTIAFQNNGKILIGGYFYDFTASYKSFFTRINFDGSLDSTFNLGNIGALGTVTCMDIQTDGKIILVGGFSSYNGIQRNGIARILSHTLSNNLSNSKNSFKFFPNPFSSQLNLQTDFQMLNMKCEIFNSLGQLVYEINGLFGNEFVFDRNNLQNGVFLYRIFENNELVYSDKIIIND